MKVKNLPGPFKVELDDPGDVVRLLGDTVGVMIMATGEVVGGAAVVGVFEAIHVTHELINPGDSPTLPPKDGQPQKK